MATYTLQLDEASYRIIGPSGEEGEICEYGTTATLRLGDWLYVCTIEDPNVEEIPAVEIFQKTGVADTQHEDVEGLDEEEDEEDEEEEGDGEVDTMDLTDTELAEDLEALPGDEETEEEAEPDHELEPDQDDDQDEELEEDE